MGMDVYGKNPSTERGSYFRNNVWWWRPLWEYCTMEHEDLVGSDPDSGHMNDGYGLNGDDALRLGHALLDDLESGRCEEYHRERCAWIATLPRRICNLCGGTGIRTDQIGLEMGQPDKALDPLVASLVDREFGWCNGCDGIGTNEPWEAQYPFDFENVREFAEFLLGCGGFEIC